MARNFLTLSGARKRATDIIGCSIAIIIYSVARLERACIHEEVFVIAVKLCRLAVSIGIQKTIPIDKIVVWIRAFGFPINRLSD